MVDAQMYRNLIGLADAAELCRWHAVLNGVQLAYESGCDCEQIICVPTGADPAADAWCELMFKRLLAVLRSGQLPLSVFEQMIGIVAAEMSRRGIEVKIMDAHAETETVH
jgi:hypothetical protein